MVLFSFPLGVVLWAGLVLPDGWLLTRRNGQEPDKPHLPTAPVAKPDQRVDVLNLVWRLDVAWRLDGALKPQGKMHNQEQRERRNENSGDRNQHGISNNLRQTAHAAILRSG